MAETTYRDFNIQRPRTSTRAPSEQIGADADLEALIDEAGRDAVFAYAAAAGWSQANPPEKWVWRQMAQEVMRLKSTPAKPQV